MRILSLRLSLSHGPGDLDVNCCGPFDLFKRSLWDLALQAFREVDFHWASAVFATFDLRKFTGIVRVFWDAAA